MKRGALLPAVVILLLAGLAPAEAAVIKKWSIAAGLEGGFVKVDADSGLGDTFSMGGRLGLSIRPSIMIEGLFDTWTADPDADDDVQGEVTTDYTGLRLVGTFFAEEDKKTLPYVAAGGGVVNQERTPDDGSNSESDEAGYGELAFGARVFLWKNLNLQAEAGFRHMRVLGGTQTNTHIALIASIIFGGTE